VVLVGINAVFVLFSPRASGGVKYVVIILFAMLHELVDHIVSPVVVSVMAASAAGGSVSYVHPSSVFVASIVVEVTNSVLAPIIAELAASADCFRYKLFTNPDPIITSVAVQAYCTGNYPTKEWCNGTQWITSSLGSYTPTFQFDASRCISGIITLYTPEYIVIFALRMLLYPLA
jgi:hypothetical protein